MPVFEVEFEVYCSCGEGLCNQSAGFTDRRRGPRVTVEPCQKCLTKEFDRGYERGHKDGVEENVS